jgi:hypothetical protein
MQAKQLVRKQAFDLKRSLMLQEIYVDKDAKLFEVHMEQMQFKLDLLALSFKVESL